MDPAGTSAARAAASGTVLLGVPQVGDLMRVDVQQYLTDAEHLGALTPNRLARGMEGSEILRIATDVAALRARGEGVWNFTIGDFDPKLFAIPTALRERIKVELDAGQTNYPPAVGIPELREAIRSFYAERLGLDYPEGSVQVGAGARPPIYAAFRTLVEPGDRVVYPVPTWNVRYYVYLTGGEGVPVVTKPEDGFMPTVDALLPHLPTARLLVLNSPLNPCGTVIAPELLREICLAVVAENDRRREAGERPLMLLYDQVYWQLTFGGNVHHTPVGLVPEMAPYTVFVDAISKWWAATGLRVGWAVAPPWVRARMQPLVGHMGAWAARAEQRATAALLAEPAQVDDYLDTFRSVVQARLERLRAGLLSMRDEGLPVDCLEAQGAIYLSARLDLRGRTVGGVSIDGDASARSALLSGAKVAVVPFTAFGYPADTGWVRFSVGAVSDEDVDQALDALRGLLRSA